MESTGGREWHALVLHAADDVAVALRDLPAGAEVGVRRAQAVVRMKLRDAIPLGHKLALHALPAGTPVRKYGEVIGAATIPIEPGAHVHVHNMRSLRGAR